MIFCVYNIVNYGHLRVKDCILFLLLEVATKVSNSSNIIIITTYHITSMGKNTFTNAKYSGHHLENSNLVIC